MNSPSNHPRRIVYLAHGGSRYMKQAVYSLYTLLYWLTGEDTQGIEIVVYTDDPTGIPRHPLIKVKALTAEALAAYKGSFNYVHRIKLAVLEQAQRDQEGAFIFVDCDTKWLKHPAPAFEVLEAQRDICLMHEPEGTVSETNHPNYFRALSRGFEFQQRMKISPPWGMWNSGTIGVPSASDGFFTDALTVTDQMLGEVQNRNWVEQLAVSLVATQRFRVQSFDGYLLHFWRDSYGIPTALDQVLPKLTSNHQQNAKMCIKFPIEAELARYRTSLRGRLTRRIARTKKSFYKRLG